MSLFDTAKQLNRSISDLLAAILQLDALVSAGTPVEASTFILCYTRIAYLLGELAELQHQITQLSQHQSEKGK